MRFEVDSEQISRASISTKTSAQTIRTEVGAMMGQLNSLQDYWRGDASSAFAGVMEQWRLTQQQVEASLDSIAACLDSGSRGYADAEASALSMFAR